MVRAPSMNAYRLVPSRRHVYELRDDAGVIAEIALHHGERANIRTLDSKYDLHAIDGIRKRVMQYGERVRTIARSSSLDRYAIDLENVTLYWHSLPGPRATYCWMTGDARIVARFSSAAEGSFIIEAESGIVSHVLIVGAYLLLHTTVEADAYYSGAPSHLRSFTTRDSF
jgi:hypothetical protein